MLIARVRKYHSYHLAIYLDELPLQVTQATRCKGAHLTWNSLTSKSPGEKGVKMYPDPLHSWDYLVSQPINRWGEVSRLFLHLVYTASHLKLSSLVAGRTGKGCFMEFLPHHPGYSSPQAHPTGNPSSQVSQHPPHLTWDSLTGKSQVRR